LRREGSFTEAEKLYRAALTENEKLVRRFPGVAEARSSLASNHADLASLLQTAKRPGKEQEELHRRAVAFQEELVALHPAIAHYRRELGLKQAKFPVVFGVG
jgi:hypothetical protein